MLRSSAPPPPAPRSIEGGTYQKTVLDNGIRVVSEAIPHVRSVSLGIWANVGSRDESQAQNGITHFLEHMVFKGTKNRSVRDIARSVEAVGGYLNASTSKEQTCFYARVLDVHLPLAMDVLSDLILNATFKKDELEKERLVVIEELRNLEDNPDEIIHDYFEKSLFPKHPVGYSIIGTEENLRRFNREDLQTHIAHHYRSDSLVVSAAGNVDHRTLVQLTQRMFRNLRAPGKSGRRQPGPPRTHRSGAIEYTRPITQAHVCLGTVAYGMKHRNRYPLLVLNALLGEGMSSRLYQSIREKHGLAYSVYSFVSMLSDTGVFGTYLGTDRKNIASAVELIHHELYRLRNKAVSRAELDRTKSQMKGTMMLSLENMSSRMMRLGSGELYFESFASLDTILKKIDAVTPESIHRVANDLFAEQALTTVIIRPS